MLCVGQMQGCLRSAELHPQSQHVDAGKRGRPGLAGRDRQRFGERPGGDDLTGREWLAARMAGDLVDQEAQRRQRTVEHVLRPPGPGEAVIALEFEGEGGKRFAPARKVAADGMALADQIGAVHAVARDCVRGGERPVRKDRLHDLEAVGDPVDAAEQFGIVHAALRRAGEVQRDFRLDQRLRQAVERERAAAGGEIVHGAVEHVVPDRPVHAIGRPDAAVGEADLAADGCLAARLAQVTKSCRHGVGVCHAETARARTERRHLPSATEQAERFGGDLFEDVRAIVVAVVHHPAPHLSFGIGRLAAIGPM